MADSLTQVAFGSPRWSARREFELLMLLAPSRKRAQRLWLRKQRTIASVRHAGGQLCHWRASGTDSEVLQDAGRRNERAPTAAQAARQLRSEKRLREKHLARKAWAAVRVACHLRRWSARARARLDARSASSTTTTPSTTTTSAAPAPAPAVPPSAPAPAPAPESEPAALARAPEPAPEPALALTAPPHRASSTPPLLLPSSSPSPAPPVPWTSSRSSPIGRHAGRDGAPHARARGAHADRSGRPSLHHVPSSSTDNTLSKHPLPQLDRAAPPEVSLPFAAICC